MQTIKEQAQAAIQQLPDSCTFEDIQYELFLVEKIRKAREAVARGEVVSNEEAKRRIHQCLTR